jgi:Outer membrane protein beta-barrel domain
MKRTLYIGWPALVLFAFSTHASAQTVTRGNDWRHGTTLNVFAGAGTDASDTGPLVGTSVGWEITPMTAVEGSGYWLRRGTGAEGFAAALKLQAGLNLGRAAIPFLEAGVGLYRTSFDSTATSVPDFYGRRMAAIDRAPGTTSTFTDPSFVLGGGVNVFVTPHIAIRPDIESMIVRRDAQNYFLTAVAVHMAYHFESHPVSRARRSR